MKHTYLSHEMVVDALEHHQITKQEAQELEKDLDRCKELNNLIKIQNLKLAS